MDIYLMDDVKTKLNIVKPKINRFLLLMSGEVMKIIL
jgi:hypothetical protein